MNKLYFLSLLFLIFCSHSLFSQAHWISESTLHHGLNGIVKSVKQFQYTAVEKFGEIEIGSKTKGPTHYYRVYDPQGFVLEETQYANKGFKVTGRVTWSYDVNNKNVKIFDYDSKNSITKETTKLYDDNQNLIERYYLDNLGQLINTTKFEYDNNNNWIESSEYNNEGALVSKVINVYDKHKNRIEYGHYSADASLIEKRTLKLDAELKEFESRVFNHNGLALKKTIEYDSLNRPIQIDFYTEKEYYWKERLTYIYNDLGKIVKQEYLSRYGTRNHTDNFYDNEGNLIRSVEYDMYGMINKETLKKYNEDGLIIEEIVHRPKDFYRNKETYEYDSSRNWIQKIEFKNEIPQIITKREIIYYSESDLEVGSEK